MKNIDAKTYSEVRNLFSQYPRYAGGSNIPYPLPCEFVISFLNKMKNGFFVDVGAHNGISWSNVLVLEKLFGWTGISIEADVDLYNELVTNVSSECLNFAISNKTDEQIFWSITGSISGLSGLESGFKNDHKERIANELIKNPSSICTKKQMIPKRLDNILADRNITHINYLSIDVEGNELEVLMSLDFKKVTCSLISVESNNKNCVDKYLSMFGYVFVYRACADDFYTNCGNTPK